MSVLSIACGVVPSVKGLAWGERGRDNCEKKRSMVVYMQQGVAVQFSFLVHSDVGSAQTCVINLGLH